MDMDVVRIVLSELNESIERMVDAKKMDDLNLAFKDASELLDSLYNAKEAKILE